MDMIQEYLQINIFMLGLAINIEKGDNYIFVWKFMLGDEEYDKASRL